MSIDHVFHPSRVSPTLPGLMGVSIAFTVSRIILVTSAKWSRLGVVQAGKIKATLLLRYACYLVIQNADPKKEIVAHGQTYFAIHTRRQELAYECIEDERQLLLREEIRRYSIQLADVVAEAACKSPCHHWCRCCIAKTFACVRRREAPLLWLTFVVETRPP